ncbi:MAG: metallophosphoesterase [Acidimicrobiia bacterium]|nr:metallophosphoesterase [Acidimicrobiia bacterium]NNL71142.1 metallophosphoesterase [Acidimicrobiia bacterium]
MYEEPIGHTLFAVRILAIADETDPTLTAARLRDIKPDLVIGCGDLGMDYLDYVSSAANACLVYVPGNHDPDLRFRAPASRPGALVFDEVWGNAQPDDEKRELAGINADGRIVQVNGLSIAGLGGSIRYKQGPNQYTQREMARRARNIKWRARLARKPVDIFIAHSPPAGLGDEDDGPHRGFESFIPLVEALQPKLMLHGHIHPHGFEKPDRQLGSTRIVNVIPHQVLEVE